MLESPTTPILMAAAEAAGARIWRFGKTVGAEFRLLSSRMAQETTIVQAEAGDLPLLFKIQSAGCHFALNGLGVLAVAATLGLDMGMAVTNLGQWRTPLGRGARERIQMDIVHDDMAFDLIDDAYNANPTSLSAALELLDACQPVDGIGHIAQGRRIAILGDMLELGPQEAEMHRAIADHRTMARIQLVHCVGPRMKLLWERLPSHRRGLWTETVQEMVAQARHLVDAGDVVLIKGSKGSKVSLVVDALRKLGQGGAVESERSE